MAEQIKQNKQGWNAVAHHFHGVDALPLYGPFAQKEEELGLFGEVRDKKVLEIGCGSGHSLHYMRKKGASELWGVDLSDEQIKSGKRNAAGNGGKAFLCSNGGGNRSAEGIFRLCLFHLCDWLDNGPAGYL